MDDDLLDREKCEGVACNTEDRARNVVLNEFIVCRLCERLLDERSVSLEGELVLRDYLIAHYAELDLEH